MVTRALTLVGLAALVALVGHPWLHPRLMWEDIADAPNHLLRIYVISHALAEGSLYPRWLPDLYLGYGYPLLNFYAPAAYYLGAALHAVGLSVFASLQWTGMIALALGATGAFTLARALLAVSTPPATAPATATSGSLFAGAVAATAYVCAPYPFITNLLVRAAIPEALALGLLPWLLYAALRLVTHPSPVSMVSLTVGIALLMLTHNVSALITLPILVAFTGVSILVAAADRLTSLRLACLALFLGLSLSAFFWLPALLESRYVQLDLLRGGIYDFRTWLFDPLRSGPAQPGLTFDYSALGRPAPEQISIWQLALWLLSLALCLPHLIRRSPPSRAALFALFFLTIALICWLFATTWSTPLWTSLPLLSFLQFPWRFHGPLALTLALAVSCACHVWKGELGVWGAQRPQRVRAEPARTFAVRGSLIAVIAALTLNSLSNRPLALAATEPPHDINSHSLAAKEYNRYGMGTTSGGEFLPRTVHWPSEGNTRRGIRIYEDAYPQASWQAGHVRILQGRAAVTQIYHDQAGIAADVIADTPTQLGLHQLAFPGWRAYLDGTPTPIGIARYEPFDASLGFIVLDVPAGQHRVEVRFGPTRLRQAANALSAAALMLIVLALTHLTARLPAPILIGTVAGASLIAVALGELHARPGATVRPASMQVVADVLSALEAGRAQARTLAGSGPALFPPYLDRQVKWIRGDERRWLYMHPPSELTLPLRVPPNAYFQAGLATDPPTWHEPIGDGVRFIVEADTEAGRVSLLDRHLHPRGRGEEQGWNDVWVPLTSLAGQSITLRLRTEHGADPNFDWAGWSNPQVVTYHSPRPHPGEPHKW